MARRTASAFSARRAAVFAPRMSSSPFVSSRALSSAGGALRSNKKEEEEEEDPTKAPRESMQFDVVIVGAGPAGLAASIRLKQLAETTGTDLSVCVVEKAAQVGNHILSGNVFEPRALNDLIPNWRELGAPLDTPVTSDHFHFLVNGDKSFELPQLLLPPELHNHGNYIISLAKLTRWMAEHAESLGVEIYAGFSASEVLYGPDGKSVRGVATRDVGLDKSGKPKPSFERGMELHARQTLFGEGCRGSCSEDVMKKLNLREGVQPQTYGLGVKEVWEVPEDKIRPGLVQHTLGWPLQDGPFSKTFGGSFLYHMKPNLVLIGFVVGLDYANPYISPYSEFQRWKHHPVVRQHLEGGTCISYGARCLNEGGYHAIPKLSFPGGALIGCSAGFLNAVKIKGSHTAMASGQIAAEAVYKRLTDANASAPVAETGEISATEAPIEVLGYQTAMEKSWVYKELEVVRNTHQAFHHGMLPGVLYTGMATRITRGKEPWTLKNEKTDAAKTQPACNFEPIEYPKPDGKLSFDLLTNLARSGTNHEEQPSHLRIKPEHKDTPQDISYPIYAAPESRFCPAKVYEYTDGSENPEGKPQLVINSQNCVHCKCCGIKTPQEYIDWTVPEGGGGPAYDIM
jgi:electron-transferring-flavoprotein dehydrogenase